MRVGGDPDGEADETTDAEHPGEQPLGDGAEAAEAEAAVLGGLLETTEVGNDVALLLGGEVAVAEGGHRLRAGQHGLVDVLGLDAVQGRGVAAARHGSAGAVEVVARGAVGEEDLATAGDGLLALLLRQAVDGVVVRAGDGGAGGERRDVRRERSDLLVVVDRLLARGLLAGVGHRHAAGADLEVDGGGADADEGGADLVAVAGGGDALAVLAVAERAAHEEELAALGDELLVAGALGLGRRERGVEATGHQQAEEEDDESGEGAAAVPGDPTCGAVQQAHSES